MAWAARDEAGVEEEDEKIEGEALSSSNDGSWNSSLKVEDLDIPCLLLYAMPQQQPQKRSQNQKPGDSTANQPTLSVFSSPCIFVFLWLGVHEMKWNVNHILHYY